MLDFITSCMLARRLVPLANDPAGENSVPGGRHGRHHRTRVLQRRHQLAHDPALPRHDRRYLQVTALLISCTMQVVSEF